MEDFTKVYCEKNQCFILHHTLENRPTNKSFFLHRQSTYEMIFFISGSLHYTVEGTRYFPKPGEIIIVKPAELHAPNIFEPVPYERIVIEFSKKLPFIFGETNYDLFACFKNRLLGQNNLFGAETVKIYELEKTILQISEHCCAGDAKNEILAKCAVIKLLTQLNDAGSEAIPVKAHPKINNVIEYINNNLNGELSIDVLAEQCYLSKYHLCRTFKENTGFTISQYISYKRIILAEMLMSEGTSVTDACFAVGYNDYSAFYKCYKKLMNQSPGEGKRLLKTCK